MNALQQQQQRWRSSTGSLGGSSNHRNRLCQFSPVLARPAATSSPRHRPQGRRAAVRVQSQQHTFVLYTKPECPLCDGLKDKLQAIIDRAAFMPCFLTGASLEVRDISTNEAWQDAMHLSVPVLALLDSSGEEVVLPRPQPRVSADRLQQHLQQALQAAGVSTDSSGGSSGDGSSSLPFTVIS